MEQTKFKRFKRIIKNQLTITVVILILCLCSLMFVNCNNATAKQLPNTTKIETVQQQKIDTISIKDSLQNQLISEVSKYVMSQAPKSHKFIPKYLVQAGLSNNIDICFMMAQTQIETCYGTTGAGRETSRRSMFGVIKRHYPTYEEAINHYCEVLKKYYLVKGRTEQHLLTKYVTGSGGRYAGNPRYEMELRLAYNNIKKRTNIHSLQEEYKKL